MILISMCVCFALIFLAGMHWAVFDNFKEKHSLWWSIGLALLGIYNLINLIGLASKA